jgi:signal transduction histidine kinase
MGPVDLALNRRILIVDDNEAIHDDFRKILGQSRQDDSLAEDEAALFGAPDAPAGPSDGYALDSAFQGQDALAAVQRAVDAGRPYALAFVDVRMPPGWDGVETIPHLWRADPALHIVICSAYSDHSWDELIAKLGLSDRLLILKKPFDAVEVRQIAVALTEKWILARQAKLKVEEVESIVETRTRDLENARVELASARDAAEAANSAKSIFLANMSHEIRTPLTAILGYVENLIHWDLAEDERHSVALTILRNGEHLLTVLNDILDVSKIEAGQLETERVECSPALVAREVADLMRVRAEQRGLELAHEISDGLPERVASDPTRLRQILANLVGNAIKFTHEGSVRLIVRFEPAEPGAGVLSFEVADTGIGMTPEQVARVFQPFQQADSTTTREFGGTGLGLYISRRLAQLLGGDVSVVETRPGCGTRLRATVAVQIPSPSTGAPAPATDQPPAAAPEGSDDSKPPRLAGRVLLVEDGADNQRLIEAILCRAGAEVALAHNGKVGLQRAMEAWKSGSPFDVILMDMQMPIMDGYEATRALRAAGYPLPVIALTAHAMRGDSQKCIDAGCDDYTPKPIRRGELIRKIHAHMRAATSVCNACAEALEGRQGPKP